MESTDLWRCWLLFTSVRSEAGSTVLKWVTVAPSFFWIWEGSGKCCLLFLVRCPKISKALKIEIPDSVNAPAETYPRPSIIQHFLSCFISQPRSIYAIRNHKWVILGRRKVNVFKGQGSKSLSPFQIFVLTTHVGKSYLYFIQGFFHLKYRVSPGWLFLTTSRSQSFQNSIRLHFVDKLYLLKELGRVLKRTLVVPSSYSFPTVQLA